MDRLAEASDQRYDMAFDDVRITESPLQKVFGPELVTVTMGRAFTTTLITDEIPVQPLLSVD
jgi:hypothetical protein